MQVTWLDRLIASISPRAGVRRIQSRMAFDLLSSQAGLGPVNKYEGASQTRRVDGWVTSGTSANAEIGPALWLLRARSHDLVRNNPHASRAISVISTHTVGTGIIPQFKGRTKTQTARLESLARDMFDTTAIDADERHTLYGLQRLVMRSTPEGGDVILRRRRRLSTDNLPLPFQVQVLEGDYLDIAKSGNVGGNLIRHGIEYNGIGKRVAYWLFPEHPGESQYLFSKAMASQRVPAEDVIHVYRMDRPGQMRGVPWAAPIIIRLRDFDEYQDAQLLRQKIAACFAGFVYDNEFPQLGDTPTRTADGTGLIDKLEPGILELLPNGKRVEFANPPSVDGHADYSRITLHTIGAGMDVPYDLLTTDQSQVNFASGRLGRLAFYQNIDDWRTNMLIPQMCRGIERWFLEGAGLIGADPRDAQAVWSPPRRQMVNPEKEVAALRDAVRSGQITLPEMVRQTGVDWDDYLAEQAEALRALDENGIMLDCDPRHTNRAGAAQDSTVDPNTGL